MIILLPLSLFFVCHNSTVDRKVHTGNSPAVLKQIVSRDPCGGAEQYNYSVSIINSFIALQECTHQRLS